MSTGQANHIFCFPLHSTILSRDAAIGRPAWFKANVTSDASLAAVLNDGAQAVLAWLVDVDKTAASRLGPQEHKWRSFARVMMAAELVNYSTGGNILKALVLAADYL